MAKYTLRLGDRTVEAELEETPDGNLRVNIDGVWQLVRLRRLGDTPRYVLVLDDRVIEVLAEAGPQGFNIQIGGRPYEIETGRGRPRRRGEELEQLVDGEWTLRAPLTGIVAEVMVAEGDAVEKDSVLLIIEAMKMLNELRSAVAGTVSALNVKEGGRAEIGASLLRVAALSAEPEQPA